MKQTNIERVFELFELCREQFEDRMNTGKREAAYGNLCACFALRLAGTIFEPDAVELERMQAAQGAMFNWFFGKE